VAVEVEETQVAVIAFASGLQHGPSMHVPAGGTVALIFSVGVPLAPS
jgi:hypothetical protein